MKHRDNPFDTKPKRVIKKKQKPRYYTPDELALIAAANWTPDDDLSF